jgi:hypothetical protein
MGDDAMHHIINDGSTANDVYTQEEGETIIDEEEEGGEEGSEYERTMSRLSPPRPHPRSRPR